MALKEYSPQVSDFTVTLQSSPLVTFFNSCKAWADTRIDLIIGGVVFFPIPHNDGNDPLTGDRMFHTQGLAIKVAVWNISGDPDTLEYCPDELRIYTNNPALYTTPPPASTVVVLNQNWEIVYTAPDRFRKITGLSPGDPSTIPGAAREFDLVFLEFSKFCELAGISLNRFTPTGTPPDYYVLEESVDYYRPGTEPLPANRGIQMSRASFDFDYSYFDTSSVLVDVDLGKARTLKFNPYPVPLLTDVASRPAVAYQLGIPCPPIWQNGGSSRLVRAAVELASKTGYIPAGEPPLPPDSPAAGRSGKPSFKDSFNTNPIFRLLLFLLGAMLFALITLLGKGCG
jgi:hypothetical protein